MRMMLKTLSLPDVTKLVFFLFVTLGTALVFILTPELLPSALISILCFFIFAPLVNSLERKGVSRGIAIMFIFVICGLGLGAGASWLVPRVSREVQTFQEGTEKSGIEYTTKIKNQEHLILGGIPFLANMNLTEKGIQWLQGSSKSILTFLPNFASHLLMALLMVPFLTFLMLRDSREISRAALKLVPNRYFETIYSLLSRITVEMGGYVAARILEAGLIMLMVTVSCLTLKIPYAVLLGFFAAATNPIPYLGPLLGAMPGVALAILDPVHHNQLFYVSMIYLVANLVDMILIFPLVVAKIVNLNPLVVVVSVILGSQIFGVLGMIIAVPITSILKILVLEVYARIYTVKGSNQY